MNQRTFITICCAVILCSCKDSALVNGTQATGTLMGSSRYPLEAGSVWNYKGTTSFKNFRPTVLGAQFPDTSWSWSARVQTLGPDTLPNGQVAWRVHTADGDPATNADSYYLLTNDTLFLYAYDGGSAIAPKQSGGMGFRFGGRTYWSAEEIAAAVRSGEFPPRSVDGSSEIIYEARPPKVLVFPLVPGQEWDYRGPGFRNQGGTVGYFEHIGKKVVSQGPVVINGMLTFAAKILWRWDMDGDLQWDENIEASDEVSSAGLVRRTFVYRDLTVTDVNDPAGIGIVDMQTEYSLTSITQVTR